MAEAAEDKTVIGNLVNAMMSGLVHLTAPAVVEMIVEGERPGVPGGRMRMEMPSGLIQKVKGRLDRRPTAQHTAPHGHRNSSVLPSVLKQERRTMRDAATQKNRRKSKNLCTPRQEAQGARAGPISSRAMRMMVRAEVALVSKMAPRMRPRMFLILGRQPKSMLLPGAVFI
jgi:hypothetical protein